MPACPFFLKVLRNEIVKVINERIHILDEGKKISRFAAVGIAATVTHGLVATALLALDMNVFLANMNAFVVAVGISFYGHYKWSFASSNPRARCFVRFVVVAAVAFGANNIFLSLLLESGLMGELPALVSAVVVIPLTTFLLSRFWVFG